MPYENPNSTVDATGNRRNHYGPRKMSEAQKFGGRKSINAAGNVEVEWVFEYDDLPAGGADGDLEVHIPAGAYLVGGKLQVVTAFAGGTSYDIGLTQKDGTVIDADGLDAAVATAAINAANEWVDFDGALIGSTAGLTFDGYLIIAATGTFTAGKAVVVVEYKEAEDDPTGNYVAGGVKGDGT